MDFSTPDVDYGNAMDFHGFFNKKHGFSNKTWIFFTWYGIGVAQKTNLYGEPKWVSGPAVSLLLHL